MPRWIRPHRCKLTAIVAAFATIAGCVRQDIRHTSDRVPIESHYGHRSLSGISILLHQRSNGEIFTRSFSEDTEERELDRPRTSVAYSWMDNEKTINNIFINMTFPESFDPKFRTVVIPIILNYIVDDPESQAWPERMNIYPRQSPTLD